MRTIFLLTISLTLFFSVSQAQSGGDYVITESVISAGGGKSSEGAFELTFTKGQALAGGALVGPGFSITSGFWTFTPMAPTSAPVSIRGRVLTADGHGIGHATVTLTTDEGETAYAYSSTFGYYRFDNVRAGATCVLTVHTRRYTFATSTHVVSAEHNIDGLNFIANR